MDNSPGNGFERHLRALGLPPDATLIEAEERYRLLAKLWHPDRFAADAVSAAEATERLKSYNDSIHWLRANKSIWTVNDAGQAKPSYRATGEDQTHEEWSQERREDDATPPPSGSEVSEENPAFTPIPVSHAADPGKSPRVGWREKFRIFVGSTLILIGLSTLPSLLIPRTPLANLRLDLRHKQSWDATTQASADAPSPARSVDDDEGNARAVLEYATSHLGRNEGVELFGTEITYQAKTAEVWGRYVIVSQRAVSNVDLIPWPYMSRLKLIDSSSREVIIHEGDSSSYRFIDIDGDGETELLVDGNSGGNACCVSLYVYGLGTDGVIALLDSYSAGTLNLADLNGDGQYSLVTFSKILWGHFPSCCAPTVTKVLKWTPKGFVNGTAERGTSLLEAELKEYRALLAGSHSLNPMSDESKKAIGGLYGSAWMLGRAATELERIRATVSPDLHQWLLDRKEEIEKDLALIIN